MTAAPSSAATSTAAESYSAKASAPSASKAGTLAATGNFHGLVADSASAAETGVGLKAFNSLMYKSEIKFNLAGAAEKNLTFLWETARYNKINGKKRKSKKKK